MEKTDVKLYRRRYIPDEKVLLKDDEIVYMDERIIATKWRALKPRDDFYGGESLYYVGEGFKISKMYDVSGNFLYYYCDIVEVDLDKAENAYTFNDLLVDVIIYKDGFVKTLDTGEIADALDAGLITVDQAKTALRSLNSLLDIIYSGNLERFTGAFDNLSS